MTTTPFTYQQALEAAELPITEYTALIRRLLKQRNAPKVSVTRGRGTVANSVYIRLARYVFDTYEECEDAAEQLAFTLGWTSGYAPNEYFINGHYDRVWFALAAAGWWHDDIEIDHPRPRHSIEYLMGN